MRTSIRKQSIDRLFRAFADKTRLRILHLLTRGELCVCDLVRALDAPQPTISRHLAYLRKAGLVAARRQGLWMHYSLSEPGSPPHAKLLECLNCCRDVLPEFARDAKRLKACGCDEGRC